MSARNELRQRKSSKNAGEQGSAKGATTVPFKDLPFTDQTIVMPSEDNQEESSFRVKPLIRYSPWFRLDVLPFAALYLILVTADYQCSSHDTASSAPASLAGFPLQTVISVAFAITLFCHAAVALMSQWRVAWKVAVGYRVVALDSDMKHWTHAHVQSLHSSSSLSGSSANVMSGIAPVQLQMTHSIGNSNVRSSCAIVDFHHHKFRYCPQSQADGDALLFTRPTATLEQKRSKSLFRSIVYPTNLPLRFYRDWKGHESNDHVILAHQVYGPNETILELPTFGELIGEQLMAPFFLFQVLCVVLWSLDEYWYYAMFTLCALLMFEATLAYNRQQSLQRLHHRASSSTGDRFWVLRPALNGLKLNTGARSGNDGGVWMRLPKRELVPGDLVSVCVTSADGVSVPADMVMLEGAAVCDEALLTGESVPQLKQALDTTGKEQRLDMQDTLHKESILFAGTKLLVANNHSNDGVDQNSNISFQKPNPPDGGATGMVLRTSFETVQGNLLRTMAYSALGSGSSNNSIHTWDTFIFILMLICCAVLAAAMVLEAGWNDERRNRFRLVLHVIIIVTSVVPPELPMELSLAVTNSVAALVRTCRVYCSELNRIPWAGEVNVCCFDKTGTLTSDEMRMRGLRLPSETLNLGAEDDGGKAEEKRLLMPDEDDIPRDTLRVMIGCHSLTPTSNPPKGYGEIRVVGDPLEQAVLKTSGYRLVGNSLVAPVEEDGGKALTILHRFAFSSKLKRMTTLVTEEGANGKIWALSKGAPETLKSKMLPDSIPKDYDSIAHHHMWLGRRVLAMAARPLGTVSSLQAYKDKGRDHVEAKLHFVGFLILDCPLKPDSKSIIAELNQTGHDSVMITGDAILTAVEVARQVAILPPSPSSETVYRIQQKSDGAALENNVVTEFECIGISSSIEQRRSSLPFSRAGIAKLAELRRTKRARFCVDGDTLICMAKTITSSSVKRRGLSTADTEDEKSFLLQPKTLKFLSELAPLISVFARHAPHQKEAIVAAFNHGGHRTLMVGDGTNDVGALKRAHVGISIISAPGVEAKHRDASNALTKMKKKSKKGAKAGKKTKRVFEQALQQLREAQEELDEVELGDASVAAPFTSRAVSIKCAKDVIQQGRCTLVTMLQIYKILGINCLVNAMVLSNLFLHGVKQGDQQLTVLGLAVAALFYFVTRAEPLPVLSEERPPSSVLCAQALISIALQFGVHVTTIALATQASLVFVDPYDMSLVPDGPFNPNVLNSCTFMLTCIATINTFAVNYRGRPFMQELRENKLMYRSLQVCYAVLAICALEVFPPLNDLMQLTALPNVHDRVVEPTGPLSSLLIHVAEQIGFPFFLFWLMVLDTFLAFLAERIARRFF